MRAATMARRARLIMSSGSRGLTTLPSTSNPTTRSSWPRIGSPAMSKRRSGPISASSCNFRAGKRPALRPAEKATWCNVAWEKVEAFNWLSLDYEANHHRSNPGRRSEDRGRRLQRPRLRSRHQSHRGGARCCLQPKTQTRISAVGFGGRPAEGWALNEIMNYRIVWEIDLDA